MSIVHYSAFIKDLKTINKRFKVASSSLRGLIEYLDKTKHSPSNFPDGNLGVKTALRYCNNPNAPKANKYKPAIKRLVQVWGKGHKAYPLGERLQKVDIKRICFRGDGRPPEMIFGSGFTKRNEETKVSYVGDKVTKLPGDNNATISNIANFTKTGDIDSPTGVCVSPNFNAAALFPLPNQKIDLEYYDLVRELKPISYIYVLYLESGYNTNLRQAMDFLEGISQLQQLELTENAFDTNAKKITAHKNRVRAIGQVLYGQEMAADAINKKHIFAAIKIQRTWKSITKKANPLNNTSKVVIDFKEGGHFRVIDVIKNQNAKYPEGFENVVEQFLNSVKGTGGSMSIIEDGFTKSLKL